jgi:hypothetical protein
MRLADAAEIEARGLFGADPMEFAYSFLPSYARAMSKFGSRRICYIMCDETQAAASIAIVRTRTMKLARWCSPPRTVKGALEASMELQFILIALQLMREQGMCDRIVQPANEALFQVCPPGSKSCPFGTYVLRLEAQSAESVFSQMHRHHRRGVRKAEYEGVKIRKGAEQILTFHTLHEETMKRAGFASVARKELEALAASMPAGSVECRVAYSAAGYPQGGLFVLKTREAAYYLHGGSVEKPDSPGAIKLAHWSLIKDCIDEGVREYNFVGARLRDVSNLPLGGIQEFKARFGSTMRKGFLWKMDLNPRKAKLYDAALTARSHLRAVWLGAPLEILHGDIIDQEIRHAKMSSLAARLQS